jgi:prolyl-tRNA editing enzyme YbaK/EbsC (Cys-tRNA(Pro) deacylase)
LLFENTKWKPLDGQSSTDLISNQHLESTNPKYVAVVVQYTDKISTKKLNLYVRKLAGSVQSSKCFNMRVMPEEIALKLTGYGKNGVSPIGMLHNVLVLVTDKIAQLDPHLVYLGAGHVDWKIGISVSHLLQVTNSHVVDLSE